MENMKNRAIESTIQEIRTKVDNAKPTTYPMKNGNNRNESDAPPKNPNPTRRLVGIGLTLAGLLALGLMLWMAPTRTAAQPGLRSPQPNQEITTNCTEASLTLSNLTAYYTCVGTPVTVTATPIIIPGVFQLTTNDNNVPIGPPGYYPSTPNCLTNWFTVSGLISTNHSGLSVTLNCTNSGTASIVFNQKWRHMCDTNTETATATNSVFFIGVGSLVSDPAGTSLGGNPPITLIPLQAPGFGSNFVEVAATPTPAVAETNLPSCWSMTGGIPFTNADGHRQPHKCPSEPQCPRHKYHRRHLRAVG